MGLIVLTAFVAGCGTGGASGADAPDQLTSEEFVEIVAALREAERAVTDQDSAGAHFVERKAAILAEHETTEAELLAFIASHDGDVARLQAVWDTISQRLKQATGEADTTRPRDATLDLDTTSDPPAARDGATPGVSPGTVKYPGRGRMDSLRGRMDSLRARPDTAVHVIQRTVRRPVPGERRLH